MLLASQNQTRSLCPCYLCIKSAWENCEMKSGIEGPWEDEHGFQMYENR